MEGGGGANGDDPHKGPEDASQFTDTNAGISRHILVVPIANHIQNVIDFLKSGLG